MDRETSLLLEEWKEIRESLRYFGNKRFAQLTVFIAASGFMLNAFLSRPEPASRVVLSLVGMTLGALFYLMERSSVRYWNRFAERGEGVEWSLGGGTTQSLWLMRRYRPGERRFSATWATFAVYVGAIVLWLLALGAVCSSALRPSLEPGDMVDEALAVAPSYAGSDDSDWRLSSMTLDDASDTYRIVLVDLRSGETLSMVFGAEDGGLREVRRAPL